MGSNRRSVRTICKNVQTEHKNNKYTRYTKFYVETLNWENHMRIDVPLYNKEYKGDKNTTLFV